MSTVVEARPGATRPALGTFERYLTIWVALCIVAGIVLGRLVPAPFQALGRMTVAEVNIPVAVLIWLMIIPMLIRVDFGALHRVAEQWRGIAVTVGINWLVKPFSMALLGWLFIGWLFRPFGKTPFDAEVAVSMGQRARGYEQPAVKIFMPSGADEPVYAPYLEHYPADVNAGFRWLYNRQPDKWRDRRNINVEGALDVRLAAMTPDERAADAVALVARIQARLAAVRLIEQASSDGDDVTDAEEAEGE
jgi:Sodium Bile acid symporter family